MVYGGGGLNKYQTLAPDTGERGSFVVGITLFCSPVSGEAWRSPGRFASGRTGQLSRELLPAAARRGNQELKTDAPSGHGLVAPLGRTNSNRSEDRHN
jgi:hypothetical protein